MLVYVSTKVCLLFSMQWKVTVIWEDSKIVYCTFQAENQILEPHLHLEITAGGLRGRLYRCKQTSVINIASMSERLTI